MNFTVFDPKDGTIVRTGICQPHMLEHQARSGEVVVALHADQGTQRIDLATLKPVPMERKHAARDPNEYQMRRLREYPSIGDQLDVIWKELANLPRTAECEAMFQRIKAVKAKYPKP